MANMAFEKAGEIVKKSDFLEAGLKSNDIYALVNQGYIKRIKRGYYSLSDYGEPKEEYILGKLMNQGVVCVESALFYYGYSDFAPREWTISVPRDFSRSVSSIRKEIPVKAYYVQNDIYPLGKTTATINGVTLPVYDRERTVCDCFKYRTKLDSEIFNKALNAYARDKSQNLTNLSKYAREMGVYDKVMNVMEVLLNG